MGLPMHVRYDHGDTATKKSTYQNCKKGILIGSAGVDAYGRAD